MSELSWDVYVKEQLHWAESFREAAKYTTGAEAQNLRAKSRSILAEVHRILRTKMYPESDSNQGKLAHHKDALCHPPLSADALARPVTASPSNQP